MKIPPAESIVFRRFGRQRGPCGRQIRLRIAPGGPALRHPARANVTSGAPRRYGPPRGCGHFMPSGRAGDRTWELLYADRLASRHRCPPLFLETACRPDTGVSRPQMGRQDRHGAMRARHERSENAPFPEDAVPSSAASWERSFQSVFPRARRAAPRPSRPPRRRASPGSPWGSGRARDDASSTVIRAPVISARSWPAIPLAGHGWPQRGPRALPVEGGCP